MEVEQRHAADRTLLDHPGDGAMAAFFQQDARHIGRDAEAEIDRPAGLQLEGDPARDGLGHVEGREAEGLQRAEDLAGDGRVIGGLGRLQLVRAR